MKTEIDSFPPQDTPGTWALTERPQEGHHSYPLSPWRQNGMTQWQGCLRALTESSKAHSSKGQPSSKGSWNRRHLYYAIGDGQLTHCWDLSIFYMNHTKKEAVTTQGISPRQTAHKQWRLRHISPSCSFRVLSVSLFVSVSVCLFPS